MLRKQRSNKSLLYMKTVVFSKYPHIIGCYFAVSFTT